MSVLAAATQLAVLAQSPGSQFGSGQSSPVTSGHAAAAPVAPSIDWTALLPLIILSLGAVLLLTFSSLLRKRAPHALYSGWTVVVAAASIVSALPLWARVQGWDKLLWWTLDTGYTGPFSTFGSTCTVAGSATVEPGCGVVGIDGFSLAITILIGFSIILGALFSSDYLRREGLEGPELYVLMLLSGAGGVVMAVANDLIVLFLGLETLSIAVYVLAAMHLKRIQSQEAGLKYFVLGAFSSAFFLYGIAMVYGATATTNLVNIKNLLAEQLFNPIPVTGLITAELHSPLLLLGLGLMLVGLGFKVAAVPFHFWSPDVYDGSPSPVVAFMASGVKAAGFAALVRVFVLAFQTYSTDWKPLIAALAVLSMVVGSVLAIVQTNIKRTLAYSSISHAGFILMALQASSPDGNRAVVFYLITYTFMVAGSFGIVTVVSRKGDNRISIDDYKGLARSNPGLALTFTVFLLAQAGVPLTSGFVAKLYTVLAAIEGGALWLAIVAMVSSVVAAFLYLRIIVTMFMGDGEHADEPTVVGRRLRVPAGAAAALVLCVVVTIGVGLFPGLLTDVANGSDPALVNVAEPPTTQPAPGTTGTPGAPGPAGAGGAAVPSGADVGHNDGH